MILLVRGGYSLLKTLVKTLAKLASTNIDDQERSMLKIFGDSINKPLGLIFSACWSMGFFLKIGKKPTLLLFIKKRQAINKEL